MGNIVLNGKTYTDRGFDPNSARIRMETSGGVPNSFSKLTDKANNNVSPTNSSVKWKLSVPVTATSDSSCACTGELLGTYTVVIDVTIPPGSLAAGRTDIVARTVDLVGSGEFASSIETITSA